MGVGRYVYLFSETTLLIHDTEDRVQWFRAWASMQRWLEDFEMKHVEFMRSIKSFHTMYRTWDTLASNQVHPGKAGFSRQQSLMYLRLHDDAVERFEKVSEPRFKGITEKNVVEIISEFRRVELRWLEEIACETQKSL